MVSYYADRQGRTGTSLRTIVAIFIVAKLRLLGDRPVVEQVKENRYIQYFCNVPDEELRTFMHHSNLTKLRKRFGVKGMEILESAIFNVLRLAGIIKEDSMLTDSTVLPNDIIYPTDVGLIFKAFGKMKQFAKRYHIPFWWDEQDLKELWREYNLNRKKDEIIVYFLEFMLIYFDALQIFKEIVRAFEASDEEEEKARQLLDLLILFQAQNEQKLEGEKHIANRIVSLGEPDARPIKKGKKHPDCEFGTTLQLSFNRQGFMVTMENFIGKPSDKILWPTTTELFEERMKGLPEHAIGDKGYRSRINRKIPQGTPHIFLGKSSDVCEEKRDFCRKARSATEGFIAVAKNIRGFGRSLYRGFDGDRIWSLLCQTAYNLKKFLQLYNDEKISDESLMKLGLLG
ncbi:transposase [Candidatus Babeliales bacterium]|nr:transposase [Candidatus Babeliales bacterium]